MNENAAPANQWISRGDAYFNRREIRRALACYARALELDADPRDRLLERWQGHMLLGRFGCAWGESDRVTRSLNTANDGARNWGDPLWDGKPLTERRVRIRCEHGLGDAIQFLRYAPEVHKICPVVLVEAAPELHAIISGIGGIDRIYAYDAAPARDFETTIECMELPHIFRSSVSSIPTRVPYISVAADRMTKARDLLRDLQSVKRVAIAWASSEWNPERNAPYELVEKLLDTPGISLISVQHGDECARLRVSGEARVLDTAADCPDIADTAAVLAQCDLLITVDTMVAHLAGALGRPVWLLLTWNSDWRWMLRGCESPWYPTMRIFRQPRPGEWSVVIENVVRAAAQFASI